MAENYWRVERPNYSSDYQDTFINGSGSHPYGLPGINCSVCKETYGNIHVVPYFCPDNLIHHKNLLRKWPISQEEHSALQRQIKEEFHLNDIDTSSFPTIYDFQPVHLKFASRPESDFLWSTLGSVIVSSKVKIIFEQQKITGVEFCPAVVEKVGKRVSVGPIPIASTGEPEDIIEEIEGEQKPAEFGPLYEMVITSVSGLPPGAEAVTQCSACGREDFDQSKRVLALTENMLPLTDVFFLATSLYIIVTDKVREVCWRSEFTNVEFSWFPMDSSR